MKWRIADWITRGVLALGFAVAAMGKLMSQPGVLAMFDRFGFPVGFHLLIGVMEMAGAALIIVPRTRYVATVLLGVIVLGAAVTHIRFDPPSELIRPLAFGVLIALVVYFPKRLRHLE